MRSIRGFAPAGDETQFRPSSVPLAVFGAFALLTCSDPAMPSYRTRAEAGVGNVLLFYYDSNREYFSGCRSATDAFLPYVGYVDTSGSVVDRFFDGVLLMDTSPFFGNPSAAIKQEWENFIEATFRVRHIDRRPLFSAPGYLSNTCAKIPYRNGCVYQRLIGPQDSLLTLTVHVRVDTAVDERDDGYIGVLALDHDGREITKGLSGLSYSTYLGVWYSYVDADTFWQERRYGFSLPEDTLCYLDIFLGSWHTPEIYYDNVVLAGGRVADGGFEGRASAWKDRSFPNSPFSGDSSAMLVALDRAAGRVARRLRDPGLRVSVILMIPWDHRSHLQTSFGSVDGKECDPSKASDATRAVRWFTKRCADEWRRLEPKWLKLTGFYWLNEAGNDFDRVSFPEIRAYLRGLGYGLYGSAYHDFWHRPSKGEEYVPYFDCLWLQPNVWPSDPKGEKPRDYYSAVQRAFSQGWLSADSTSVRRNGIPLEELKAAGDLARRLNMGVNMEWARGQECVDGYGMILHYINEDGSLPHDFSQASHLFYDAAGFGWYCCHSDSEVYRQQYDAVREFVRRIK